MGMMETACPHCGTRNPDFLQLTESRPGSYGKGMPRFEDRHYFCLNCGIDFTRRIPEEFR